MSETDNQSGYTLGLQFNQTYVQAGKRGVRPPGCPEWANPMQLDKWKQRGIVMWQEESRRLVTLGAIEAVAYLDRLRTNVAWRSDGISITRRVYVGRISSQTSQRTGEEGRGSSASRAGEKSRLEPVDEEVMRLNPEQAGRLLDLLQQNEAVLCRMAEAEGEIGQPPPPSLQHAISIPPGGGI